MSTPLLTEEVKTNVTKETKAALDEIATVRGEGTKVTQLLREAIRDYIAKHRPKSSKKI